MPSFVIRRRPARSGRFCPQLHRLLAGRLLSAAGGLLLLFACGTAVLAAEGADDKQAPQDATLPIQKVVMFSSGVAYFEHGGQVEGDARVDLKFNVEDINDLLKSMVLQDLDDGKISTVNYASRDPLTRALKTFSIDLTEKPSLSELLNQMRGERVKISTPNEVTGAIVSVEMRKRPVGDDKTIELPFLNLFTDAGLRSINLEQVTAIELLNPKLNNEFKQALLLLALENAEDKKSVQLNFVGEGRRRVRVGYIQEAPIWKTSYRLVLKDEGSPLLQGWAIVENTTEADWQNVDLTLVSGRPISFMMDLYRPLYVDRPEVALELHASIRPPRYEQDLLARDAEFERKADGAAERQAARGSSFPGRGGYFGGGMGGMGGSYGLGGALPQAPAGVDGTQLRRNAAAESREEAFNIAQGVDAQAAAGDVGELFQYKIDGRVSLPRQQSAMLPIVNGPVEAEKVSIYNRAVHAKHPLNGLRLENTTALHLMQGPITVFDDNVYAGDAQIPHLEPGTKRLLSYAIDLGTEVAVTSKSTPERLTTVRIVKGVLHATRKYERTSEYVVKNSNKHPRKVLIEQPVDAAWKLIEPAEPDEKTRDVYRLAVTAEPGKPAALKAVEEQIAVQVVALTNLDDNAIRLYVNSPTVSDAIKKALAETTARKQAISELAAERQRLQQQLTAIDQEQSRIRQNMERLDKTSDLYIRYVKKLTEQEDEIEGLRKQIANLLKQEQEKKIELDRYVIGLSLD